MDVPRADSLQPKSPPSTSTTRPVTKSFSAMKTAVAAISAGSPSLCSGTAAFTRSTISGFIADRISVAQKPGAMAALRIP